jgi:hypothetical protein
MNRVLLVRVQILESIEPSGTALVCRWSDEWRTGSFVARVSTARIEVRSIKPDR